MQSEPAACAESVSSCRAAEGSTGAQKQDHGRIFRQMYALGCEVVTSVPSSHVAHAQSFLGLKFLLDYPLCAELQCATF